MPCRLVARYAAAGAPGAARRFWLYARGAMPMPGARHASRCHVIIYRASQQRAQAGSGEAVVEAWRRGGKKGRSSHPD